MTKEQKAKWLEALRSGKYKQGEGYLHTAHRTLENNNEVVTDEFCCLGVYCEANGIKGECIDSPSHSSSYGLFHYYFQTEEKELREADRGWVTGLPEDVLNQASQGILINMNDTRLNSFDEIADWIEDNVWTEDQFE